MKSSLAKICVQHPFCTDCVGPLKKKIIAEVQNIKNLTLDATSSLVMFNFNQVNQVAEVLNTLMAVGHPQEGDQISSNVFTPPLCSCLVDDTGKEQNSTYSN